MFVVPIAPYTDPVNEAGFQDDLLSCCFLDKGFDAEGLDVCAPVAPVFLSR